MAATVETTGLLIGGRWSAPPFRGIRDSGSAGSPPEQGETARDSCTELKTVYAESM